MGAPLGHPKYGGRKKGTTNKLTSDVKQMILNSLQKAGGEEYLLAQSQTNPTAYLTLVGKVLPLTLSGDKENPVELNVTSPDKEIIQRYIEGKK